MIRKEIIFKGQVQGVGFRFRCKYLANSRNVTGWVRNEPDGTVKAVMQGNESDIDSVIINLDRNPYTFIEGMEVKSLEVVDGEYNFYID